MTDEAPSDQAIANLAESLAFILPNRLNGEELKLLAAAAIGHLRPVLFKEAAEVLRAKAEAPL